MFRRVKDMWSFGEPEYQAKERETIKQIKFRKVEDAPYGCHATYEWEGHIIEADADTNFNGGYIWHCDTLFKQRCFRTLKGIRKAIALKELGWLTKQKLEDCEEM